jgi:ATP-dependent Clp protease ATP-binding subunit ClpC
LKSPLRPVGSFIFLGPTGVGKTEVARTLAEFLFGNESALIRFDMSEYMEKHSIAKMIGSPPGYVGHEEGGQLTERVKRRPYSVILLDEIEKAHRDVLNILLQVLEDGQLTDAYGDTVDFKNVIVIMTSNLGSEHLLKGARLGFGTGQQDEKVKATHEVVMLEVRRSFRPEFLNRIDDIIVFDPLTEEQLLGITRLMIDRLNDALREKGVRVELTEEAYEWLVRNTCKDRSYGARPLRRAIQKHIEDALSERLIEGRFQGVDLVEVFLEDDRLAFREVQGINSAR